MATVLVIEDDAATAAEIVARVAALLRRQAPEAVLQAGGVELDLIRRATLVGGTPSRARWADATAEYRGTVRVAFQPVEDGLAQLHHFGDQATAEARAVDQAAITRTAAAQPLRQGCDLQPRHGHRADDGAAHAGDRARS